MMVQELNWVAGTHIGILIKGFQLFSERRNIGEIVTGSPDNFFLIQGTHFPSSELNSKILGKFVSVTLYGS